MKQQKNIETMAESQIRLNIFLVQNKGKGPPGRECSPGAGVCRKPDYEPAILNNIKIDQKTDFQYFNNNQILNFYSHN